MDKTKILKNITKLNRVLGVLFLAAIVATPFLWQHMRYKKDFQYVNFLFNKHPATNPFIYPLPPLKLNEPQPLSMVFSKDQPYVESLAGPFKIKFPDDPSDRFSGGVESNTPGFLENSKIKIAIGDSIANIMLIRNKSIVSFMNDRWKSYKIREFEHESDVFGKLKKVYESQLSDIDTAPDLSSRYLALYLYGLKASIQPRESENAYFYFQTPEIKGVLFGLIENGEVKLTFYSSKYNHFFSVLFIKKGAVSQDDIKSLIAKLSISENR